MPQIRIIEYAIFRAFFPDFRDFPQIILFWSGFDQKVTQRTQPLLHSKVLVPYIDTIPQLITALERK